MDSYRASAGESLRALLACCFTAAPCGGGDRDDMYQQPGERRLPWFLGGDSGDARAGSDADKAADADKAPLDDVLATSSTAIAPGNQPPPRWFKDDRTAACAQCNGAFDLLTRRRHHCRACGGVFCQTCSAQRERVVKFGFDEPVRVCRACAVDARAQNEFYARHLPLLERGAVFVKHGLLRKRLVVFKFVRAKLLFQYQTLDAETRKPVPNEIKAFLLDSIIDVKHVPIDKENGMLGLLIVVGPNNEEHRLDATTPEQKQQWVAAIESVRTLRASLIAKERDRRAQHAQAQHAEMLKATESMRRLQEKKDSFHQERMQKRAEQRELLRAKYQLGSSSSSVGATTAAS